VVARSLAAQRNFAGAAKEAERAITLSAGSENAELHLAVGLIAGRVHAGAGQRDEALKLLRAELSNATAAGFAGYQLDARLALAEVAVQSGTARPPLTDLEKEASAKGFLLIARKAAAVTEADESP
jgi:tetratricopeptide (TPR) repeat protein